MAFRMCMGEKVTMSQEKVTIDQIAKIAGVSKATVSRVINGNQSVRSESRQKVEEVIRQYNFRPSLLAQQLRGGANSYGPLFSDRLLKHRAQKQAIAREAKNFLRDGQTIFLDAGSTTLELAYLMGDFKNMTVVTTSVAALAPLQQSEHRIVLAGGDFIPAMSATGGSIAERTLKKFHADIAFVGGSAMSWNRGLYCYSADSCRLKRLMIERSETRCLLMDASKANEAELRYFVSLDKLDYLITDEEFLRVKNDRHWDGLQVIYAAI